MIPVRAGVLVSVLAAVGAGAGVPASAARSAAADRVRQARRAREASVDLATWLSAVKDHVAGKADAPLARIGPWTRQRLDRVLNEALDRVPPADGPLLKRAAVLHADIAAAHRGERGYSLPSDGRTLELLQDGNRVGAVAGTVHWGFGRRLLGKLEADGDVRLWYRATAALLQLWREYAELEPHLKRARDLFPDDAVLLLYEGTLHAAYADPLVQSSFAQPASLVLTKSLSRAAEPQRVETVGSVREELAAAQRAFEEALQIEPELTEARLRLGCVLGLLGRHEAAAEELKRAAACESSPPSLQYYAWLLLGREQEALGRTESARDALRRAAALYPGAQSPLVALSRIARAEGDLAAARGILEPLGRGETRTDPWWTFQQWHEPDQQGLLAEMWRRLAP